MNEYKNDLKFEKKYKLTSYLPINAKTDNGA